MKRIVVAALVVLFQVPHAPADRLRESAAAIAQGAGTVDRRAAITQRLKTMGVEFHLEEFTIGNRSGSNIVATIPGKPGSKTLLLGAHYDRVARGRGAVDNAGSCAVLLELAERLKSIPLSGMSVTVAFFDLEELGLFGSRAYFQSIPASELPSQAMNFDVFAYGETLFVTPSRADGPLLAALQRAALEYGFPLRAFPLAQYPSSDHQSMARAGVETLGVTLIDGSEIDAIVTPGPVPPRVLAMIHTDADTMDQVREQDMAKAMPVLERTVRLLDAAGR